MNTDLNRFLVATYVSTGFSVGGTLTLAHLFSQFIIPGLYRFIIGIITLILTGYILWSKPKYANNQSYNPKERLAAFGAMIIGNGIVLAPIAAEQEMFRNAALITTVIMFGAAFVACYFTLSGWKPILITGTVVFSGVLYYLDFELFETVDNFFIAGGIALFTGFMVYDHKIVVTRFNRRKPDHLFCAVILYEDFLALLLKIFDLLNKIKEFKGK